MITKAIGGARRSSTVAANTNRTIGRLKIRMSMIWPPKSAMTRISPRVRSAPTGIRMNSARPGRVSRSQVRASAVMPKRTRGRLRAAAPKRSLVDAAHHWVEAGHDRHGVGQEVAREQRADGLQVD